MAKLKQQLLDVLNTLPDDCTMDDIQYHLFVRRSVERGIMDIEEGRVLSVDEMERRIGNRKNSPLPSRGSIA